MRVIEILLPKSSSDRSISAHTERQLGLLKARMDSYIDKICNPSTTSIVRDFLKAKLSNDYRELRELVSPRINEAVHKLPLSNKDFDIVKDIMDRPIPAAIATIYLHEIIEDDELNDILRELEDSDPGRDVRPLVAEWIERVMPDQMYRFRQGADDTNLRKGILSPIHGYDSHMYKGSNEPITGDAYGRR